jgi:hypothetical protein
MGVFNWLTQNWFVLLQSAGIIGSLLFTGIALYSDTKSRRVSNLVALTRQHRDIWTDFSKRPELARVLDANAKISATPVSSDEEIFVTVLVLHLNTVYHAKHDGLVLNPEGLREDIHAFFSLPIPSAVWAKIKSLQDHEFVNFVETCLAEEKDLSRLH